MRIGRYLRGLIKMTSTSNIQIKKHCSDMSSRESGKKAFEMLKQQLALSDEIIIDFKDALMTPSFVDECIGGLANMLGKEGFKKRVHFMHVTPETKSLLMHVIAHRI